MPARTPRHGTRSTSGPSWSFSTNREFLEAFEEKYGGDTLETHSGDVPSWWAEGPRLRGQGRRAKSGCCTTGWWAIEGLWTAASLLDPGLKYPKARINAALEKVMLFDEHTWGASGEYQPAEGCVDGPPVGDEGGVCRGRGANRRPAGMPWQRSPRPATPGLQDAVGRPRPGRAQSAFVEAYGRRDPPPGGRPPRPEPRG